MRRSAILVLVLALAGCAGDDSSSDTTAAPSTTVDATTTPTEDTTAPQLAPASFTVRPGVLQVAVLDAEPGAAIEVIDADGAAVADGEVDDAGSYLARELEPGEYVVRTADEQSDPVTVLAIDEVPDADFYADQELASGYGYLTARDGTTLSINAVLPGPADAGPYPTVVEYSGYSPSNPESAGFARFYNALGYAYVGVNIRGTGCSGGSMRLFDTQLRADGYDVVEAVAAEPWVLGHRVGLVGVSYPGITQLYVASTRPPSLAAITPFSILDDSYRSTMYPGGLLNTGFAVDWVAQRVEEAQPEGQQWAADRIADGDTECEANQALRLQNPDMVAEVAANETYDPAVADPINPSLFVDQIEVPVLVAGAFQDEQTGGRFPALLDDFTGTEHLYATLTNGLHTESALPGNLQRTVEFLDLYVAQRTPSMAVLNTLAPTLAGQITGVSTLPPFPDRFAGMTYDEALAVFESEPPIRILMEEGAADGLEPGTPYPRWVIERDAWPAPDVVPTRWYLGAGGTLSEDAPTDASAESTYTADPDALPDTFYDGSGNDIWKADVTWDWQPIPAGTGVGFETAPLTEDLVIAGPGSVDLWITSSTGDTDLEVTVSEVRPDGQEMYVQSGWLRASHRALDEDASTELQPVQSHLADDVAPLPDGEPTPVRVELFPFAHAFRAGSRLRITIDAPGNARGVWVFDTISGGETVTIAHDADHPSSLVLGVLPDEAVPTGLPTCGAVRGQPCRAATPLPTG
jgi:hypothetical protein